MSGSKLLRLCSLFLCLLLCLANFSVVANAAEAENLVDSNLSNWTDYSDESEYFESPNISYLDNNVNYIEVSGSSYPVYIFDVTEFLKIGESYNFSFNLPTTGGSNSTSLNSCELHWCLTDGNGDSVPSYGSDVFKIVVNNSNKSNYLGKTTVFEFTYTQGFQNTFLCLAINPGENLEAYNDLELYISDISLERVTTESEKKLDGILGWLEDIKNSITGLGDKLTSVWENITSSVSALGDRISGFFSDLGNTISTKFNELTTNFSNFITNLGDRISDFFDNLITNVKTFFEELPGKIFNYQVEEDENGNITGGSGSDGESSNDNILNLFDGWYSNHSNCKIVFYDDFIYFEESRAYADWRYDDIPLKKGYKSVLNFTISNSNGLDRFDYYINCSNSYFNETLNFKSNGTYSLELPEVPVDTTFNIRIGDNAWDTSIVYFNLSDCYITYVPIEDGSTGDTGSDEGSSGSVSWFQFIINKFKSWFTGLGESIKGFFLKLVDDIKGLFIPPEGFFEEWKDKFDLMLSDNLGFVYQAPNFVIQVIYCIQDVLNTKTEPELVFPKIEFDIVGYHVLLFEDAKVDFSFLDTGIWSILYGMYKVMVHAILIFALIKLAQDTWERMMEN